MHCVGAADATQPGPTNACTCALQKQPALLLARHNAQPRPEKTRSACEGEPQPTRGANSGSDKSKYTPGGCCGGGIEQSSTVDSQPCVSGPEMVHAPAKLASVGVG